MKTEGTGRESKSKLRESSSVAAACRLQDRRRVHQCVLRRKKQLDCCVRLVRVNYRIIQLRLPLHDGRRKSPDQSLENFSHQEIYLQQRNLCRTLKRQTSYNSFYPFHPKGALANSGANNDRINKAGSAFVFTVGSLCDFTDAMSLLKYIQIHFPSQLLWKIVPPPPPSRKFDRIKKELVTHKTLLKGRNKLQNGL